MLPNVNSMGSSMQTTGEAALFACGGLWRWCDGGCPVGLSFNLRILLTRYLCLVNVKRSYFVMYWGFAV